MGGQQQRVHGFAQGLVQREHALLDGDLASLDLGDVQQVVDDEHQTLRRAVGKADEFALTIRQLGLQHQFGQAQHAVHRRADLVAHVRQEAALGLAGRFGRLARGFQCHLGGLQIADVAGVELHGGVASDGVTHRPGIDRVPPRAGFGQQLQISLHALPCQHGGEQLLCIARQREQSVELT